MKGKESPITKKRNPGLKIKGAKEITQREKVTFSLTQPK